MSKIICHICDSELAYQKYTGTKLLDEEGNKPCLQCLLEAEEEEDGE